MIHLSNQKKRILIIILFLLCGALQVLSGRLNATGASYVTVLGINVPKGSAQGVFSSVISLICVFMVCLECRFGKLLSCIAIAASVAGMLSTLIRFGDLTPLPGLINTVFTLVSIFLISGFLKGAEDESITDIVTQSYNRLYFERTLEGRISSSKKFEIAFIQIRGFRSINDSHGRDSGDKVLKMIAERLREVVGVKGEVFRLDGTDFAVIYRQGASALDTTNDCIRHIMEKYRIERGGIGVNCYIEAYGGIASYPRDAADVLSVMRCADIAMNYAMTSQKERVKVFTAELESEATRRTFVEQQIKLSLENDYFYLVYQPQYMLAGKTLRGFETLLRCKLPDGTMISPAEFIPISEQTDIIYEIDNYVINRALGELGPLIKHNPTPMSLSINVSAKSMSTVDFVDKVKTALVRNSFPAECLEIELTEHSFARSREMTISNAIKLREMGVKIALDDFGTGYTSLERLLRLPITLLKIDGSLIQAINEGGRSKDMINVVIYMGHMIGCEVIAEGVENDEQLEMLQKYNCDSIQGFVWAKPMEFRDAVKMI